MKKVIIILVILTIGFNACQKEKRQAPFSQSKNDSTKEVALAPTSYPNYVSNSNNPMDIIGAMHNEAMDIMATPEILDSNISENFYIETLTNYLIENECDTTKFLENIERIKAETILAINYLNQSSIGNYYQNLLDRQLITALQYNYLIEMVTHVDQITNLLLSHNGDMIESYKELNSRLIMTESAILQNPNFDNENQRNMLLATSSIYRYSMYNYIDVIQNESNRWNILLTQAGGVVPNEPTGLGDDDDIASIFIIGADWRKIGHADVAGALGALSGIGVYAIFYLVTWEYVAALGLGGAVGASVIELYLQWVNGNVFIIW